MSRNRNRTRAIRQRMARTGENYTRAMRAIDAERAAKQEDVAAEPEEDR